MAQRTCVSVVPQLRGLLRRPPCFPKQQVNAVRWFAAKTSSRQYHVHRSTRLSGASARAYSSSEKPTGSQQQEESSPSTDKALQSKEKSTAPATAGPREVQEVDQNTDVSKKEDIDQILIRAHTEEIIQKSGEAAERYLPNKDPTAFLIEENKLTPSEKIWQKVFVALPYAVFVCMLSVPFLLLNYNLPRLQKRKAEGEVGKAFPAAAVAQVPDFEIVSFNQMTDVVERHCATVTLLFAERTFASKIFLPAFYDLAALFKAAGLPVAIVAMDLSREDVPLAFAASYPPVLAPYIQFIHPRAAGGEPGIVDYEGQWNAVQIVTAAIRLVESTAQCGGPALPEGAADEVLERTQELDSNIEMLRDSVFELLFIEDAVPASQKKESWWGRLTGSSAASGDAEEATKASLNAAEQNLELGSGVQVALASIAKATQAMKGTDRPKR